MKNPHCRSFCALRRLLPALALGWALLLPNPACARPDKPSRPAEAGCRWLQRVHAASGLAVWTERCLAGQNGMVEMVFQGNQLVERFADGAIVWPGIEILDLLPGETVEAGLQRIFNQRTPQTLARRCKLVGNPGSALIAYAPPAGAVLYTFIPDAAYQAELDAARNDDVPEPPCGELGVLPDATAYLLGWPHGPVRKLLFVKIGQEQPMFDEKTLKWRQP